MTSPKFKIGSSRDLYIDDLFEAHALLNEIVFETDKAARNKFDLQAVEIVSPGKTIEGGEANRS